MSKRKNRHAVALGRLNQPSQQQEFKPTIGKRIIATELAREAIEQVLNPHAVALGRKGGRIGGLAQSEAKTLAARANGAKGGRPRKFLFCKMPDCGGEIYRDGICFTHSERERMSARSSR